MTPHPTDAELEAMAVRLEAMPRPAMLDALTFCPHDAAAMLRAYKLAQRALTDALQRQMREAHARPVVAE